MEDWPTYPNVIANLVGANNEDLEIRSVAVTTEIAKDCGESETVNKLFSHYSSWHRLKRE
jgi:hypothetical protein